MLEITTHWQLLDGNMQDVINIVYLDEETSKSPELPTDIVDEAKTIVLEHAGEEDQCSLNIRSINNLILSISFAVSYCKRAEVFTGISSVYRETINGEIYSEINELDVYRYDIKFEKGESLITIKLIPQDNTIVMFGVFINAIERLQQQNPFPMGMDMLKVQDLLKDSGVDLSENAKKCKSFLEMALKGSKTSSKPLPSASGSAPALPEGINVYLEGRLKTLEENLSRKLEEKLKEMEERQNEKLAEILEQIKCLQVSK
ncbi:ATPase PAAT-like [Sergentomyia squamirostris]